MTDHDADDQTTADNTPSGQGSTVPALLLALQAVDTEADQLAHRRVNSPLREAFVATSRQVEEWERRRASLRESIGALGQTIAAAEERNAELLQHREKLDQQLKTVIAPREAEALMHEITTIETQRDELDMEELEALEQQSVTDDELSEHLAGEETVRTASRLADDALAEEVAEIDSALTSLGERREEMRSELPEPLLATYDRKRDALGVAVASLVGKQCQGCHLELSAAEIDTVREEAAATGVTDCPDCGRLLIV